MRPAIQCLAASKKLKIKKIKKEGLWLKHAYWYVRKKENENSASY
jgi:hypothetical protein